MLNNPTSRNIWFLLTFHFLFFFCEQNLGRNRQISSDSQGLPCGLTALGCLGRPSVPWDFFFLNLGHFGMWKKNVLANRFPTVFWEISWYFDVEHGCEHRFDFKTLKMGYVGIELFWVFEKHRKNFLRGFGLVKDVHDRQLCKCQGFWHNLTTFWHNFTTMCERAW